MNKKEVILSDTVTTLCFYEDKHPCPAVLCKKEIAKKDAKVKKKKNRLVSTLAVNCFIEGYFEDIANVLTPEATYIMVGHAELARSILIENYPTETIREFVKQQPGLRPIVM